MPTLITDPDLKNKIQAQRWAWNIDRYDEEWLL